MTPFKKGTDPAVIIQKVLSSFEIQSSYHAKPNRDFAICRMDRMVNVTISYIAPPFVCEIGTGEGSLIIKDDLGLRQQPSATWDKNRFILRSPTKARNTVSFRVKTCEGLVMLSLINNLVSMGSHLSIEDIKKHVVGGNLMGDWRVYTSNIASPATSISLIKESKINTPLLVKWLRGERRITPSKIVTPDNWINWFNEDLKKGK